MKLKALVAALAIIGAGAANAAISLPNDATQPGSVLFTLHNSGATMSSLFDLGLTRTQFASSDFAGVVGGTSYNTITWNFATNTVTSAGNWNANAAAAISSLQSANNSWSTAWNAYAANASGSVYSVFSSDRDSSQATANYLLSTVDTSKTNNIATASNLQLLNASSTSQNTYVNANNNLGTHLSSDNGANIATSGSAYNGTIGSWRNGWNNTLTMFSSTASVDKSMAFYTLQGAVGGTTTKVAVDQIDTAFWTVDAANGTLTYTVAAVPEPSSIAMLLAGLGLMGFIARRRLA